MSRNIAVVKESSLKNDRANQAAPTRMHAEILIDGDTSMGSYVTEGEDRFIIGSSKRADLVMPHASISKIHAMLRLVDTDILLYDLGSEGGTFVGGGVRFAAFAFDERAFKVHGGRLLILRSGFCAKGGERAYHQH